MSRAPHALGLASTLAWGLLQALPAQTPEAPIPEVVVEAPEPQFAAPTLRDRIGRVWAPVLIDGKGPFRLVLDTGASNSAITSRVVDALGVVPPATSTTLLHGFTGVALVPVIQVNQMEVGELLIRSSKVPIVADVFGGAEGVLGQEGMRDKRILIDFGRDRIVISRSHREHARMGYNTVPLRLIRGGLLVADVQLGTIRAKAIIDTGSQRTVGNLALQRALMRRLPADARDEDIYGVTLDYQRGKNLPTPPIVMGGLVIEGAYVTFGDMFLFEHWKLTREPTLMLGMDVLGLVDVLIIDYRMRELQVRRRG